MFSHDISVEVPYRRALEHVNYRASLHDECIFFSQYFAINYTWSNIVYDYCDICYKAKILSNLMVYIEIFLCLLFTNYKLTLC